MDYTKIFTNKAEAYRKYRPSYSLDLLAFLKNSGMIQSGMTVADVGCGTGIFSYQLLKYDVKIFGVEPNATMRKEAKKYIQSDSFVLVNGTAENTTLSDFSIDLITVAQAFHWFNPLKFRDECKRISATDGTVLLVWNRKELGEMEIERKKIVNKYYHIPDVYDCDWQKREEGISIFFGGKYNVKLFDNDIVNNYEEFIGRTLSASHAIERTDKKFNQYLQDWEAYFKRYSVNGKIIIPNKTVAFWGKVK